MLKFTGQYWVLGVDIEQYDPEDPYKYLHGLLQVRMSILL